MKATGIVRRIDELGRIVIPMEIRNNMNIKEKDEFQIYIEDNKIILYLKVGFYSSASSDAIRYCMGDIPICIFTNLPKKDGLVNSK